MSAETNSFGPRHRKKRLKLPGPVGNRSFYRPLEYLAQSVSHRGGSMKSKLGSLTLSVLPLIFVALVSAVPARAQGAPAQSAQSNLTVTYPTGFTVSPPVSQISQPSLPTVQTIIPLRPRPLAGGGALAPSVQDQALQTAPGGALELEDEGGNPRFPGVGRTATCPRTRTWRWDRTTSCKR